MKQFEPAGKEEIAFQGRIVEVIQQPMKLGEKTIVFERAQRSPGVRLIIVKDNKILLSKEKRYELGEYDWRLPGGKVFDTLEEYNKVRQQDSNLLEHAIAGAKKEAQEEVGINAKKITHIHTTTPGATIVWNLFYFLIEEFDELQQQEMEHGEVIHPEWKTFEEVKRMCLNKEIKEDRTVAVLLRFLLHNK